jgi:prepilin-type N-terminal cleavage/methylation domain-containing protein
MMNTTGRRDGFTLIELVIVITIAGIIMVYAVPRFQGMRATRTARNSRDVFVWLAQRARARAIQTGQTWLYEIDPANERVWIVRRGGSAAADTLTTVNFVSEYESTTMSTAANTVITVCYNPRGYASTCTGGSGSSPTNNVDVTFTNGSYTSSARLKPLGQVERL